MLPGQMPAHLWKGRGTFSGPIIGCYNVLTFGPYSVNSGETAALKAVLKADEIPGFRIIAVCGASDGGSGASTTVIFQWNLDPLNAKSGQFPITASNTGQGAALNVSVAGTGEGHIITGDPNFDSDDGTRISEYRTPPSTTPYLVIRGSGTLGNNDSVVAAVIYQTTDHINANPRND